MTGLTILQCVLDVTEDANEKNGDTHIAGRYPDRTGYHTKRIQKSVNGSVEKKLGINITFASWNVRTTVGHYGNQLKLLTDDLNRLNIDICAIQETRRQSNEILLSDNYKILLSSADKNGNLGVAFAIKRSFENCIKNWQPISDRLGVLNITIDKTPVTLVTCHAPTENAPLDDKISFYSSLQSVTRNVTSASQDLLFILGDFNGNAYEHETENDFLMDSFINQNKLQSANNSFKHKKYNRTTFKKIKNNKWHTYDHALMNSSARKYVTNCRNVLHCVLISDHRPIRLKTSFRPAQNKRKYYTNKNRSLDFDPATLRRPETQHHYVNTIQSHIDISSSFSVISSQLRDAARYSCPKKRTTTKHWFNEYRDILYPVLAEKANSFQEFRKTPTTTNHNTYKYHRLQANNLVSLCKNKWISNIASNIQESSNANNWRDVYRTLPKLKEQQYQRKLALKTGNCLAVNNQTCSKMFKEHFEESLNCDPPSNKPIDLQTFYHKATEVEHIQLLRPPSDSEILCSLNNLKYNKAAGPDRVHSELWKCGGTTTFNIIKKQILDTWESEKVDPLWVESQILPLFKKGDKSDVKNYRPISILNTSGSVLTDLITRRLKAYTENRLSESQYGFRKNRSTQDLIFCVRQLQEHCVEWNKPLFAIFIDFKTAFDSIDRPDLFRVLHYLGIPAKIISIIQSLHTNTTSRVKIEDSLSSKFMTSTGVRQGCKMAPLLFIIHIDTVIKELRRRYPAEVLITTSLETWYKSAVKKTHDFNLRELLFADDLTLIVTSQEIIASLLTIVDAISKSIGLKLNTQKTAVMCLNPNFPINTKIVLNDQSINVVKEFKLLGSIISDDGTLEKEIKNRISTAKLQRWKLSNVWKSNIINKKTKLSIFKAKVMSTLLYACESWVPKYRHYQSLRGFVTSSLKIINNIRYNTHITNKILYSSSDTLLPEITIKQRRLQYFGHVLRMGPSRLPQLCLLQRYLCPRPSQGVRKRWRDIILQDLKDSSIPANNVTALTRDRTSWRQTVLKIKCVRQEDTKQITKRKLEEIPISLINKKPKLEPKEELKRIILSPRRSPVEITVDPNVYNNSKTTNPTTERTKRRRQHNHSTKKVKKLKKEIPLTATDTKSNDHIENINQQSTTSQKSIHICTQCTRSCKSYLGLLAHLRKHERDKTAISPSQKKTATRSDVSILTCHLCDFTSVNLAGFKSHQRKHERAEAANPPGTIPAEKDQPITHSEDTIYYKCSQPGCKYTTFLLKNLHKHRNKNHNLESENRGNMDSTNKIIDMRAAHFTCPYCDRTSTKSGLTRHFCKKRR